MTSRNIAKIINAVLGCLYLLLAWQFLAKLFEEEEDEPSKVDKKDGKENADTGA